MNKQTKRLRKLGISRKMQSGVSDPTNYHSGYAVDVAFEIYKGRPCPTGFDAKNPECKKNGPRKARGKQAAQEI